MEIEPLLLAQKDDDSFRLEFMKVGWKERQIKKKEEVEVELPDMGQGQSFSRTNRVTDWTEQDSRISNSVLKLDISEIFELKLVFKRLARLSPEDQFISKQTFLHYFPLEGKLGERLFKVFDRDNDERINAFEFLSGISLCLRGSMSDKCELLFNMFDLNGDEGVSEDELFSMLKPTLKAADSLSLKLSPDSVQIKSESEDFGDVARLLVHEAFEECDLEQSGKLSSEGFQKWLASHKELVKAIFNNPFHSVMKRQKFEELKPEAVRNRRIQPQTWMDEISDNDPWSETEPIVSLENAKYLWSPLFPKAESKFPPSRLKHANVLYDGKIYIFGGRSKTSTLKDIWIYNIAENVWSSVENQNGPQPPALQEHSAVLYRNNVYIFGGAFTTDLATPFWSYNFETSTWKNLSRRKFQKEPCNRRSHSAVVFRNSMYIFGGYLDSGASSADIWQYNFTTYRWQLLRPKPGSEDISARHSQSSIVHNNALWVFGGLDSRGRKNDLWRWDFAQSAWNRVRCKTSPPPVAGHTCTKVGCLMVTFGGESTNELRNDTWTYSFESCKWIKITPFSSISPTVRCHHTAVVLNPYSIHSGLVRRSRPNTTKSAPESKNYNRLTNRSPVHRVASADSILDYHQNRIVKGKSLDLQLQLDNDGYERSFPDVSYETDYPDFSSSDLNSMSDLNVDSEDRGNETSFMQNAEAISTQRNNDWAVVIIGGKGKRSSDMYKTTVDMWKCDIGHDVDKHCQVKSISVKGQNTEPLPFYRQTKIPQSYATDGKQIEKDPKMKKQLISNEKRVYDQLIITDLTNENDESEVVSSRWETKTLLR